jgi:hypothetical protein
VVVGVLVLAGGGFVVTLVIALITSFGLFVRGIFALILGCLLLVLRHGAHDSGPGRNSQSRRDSLHEKRFHRFSSEYDTFQAMGLEATRRGRHFLTMLMGGALFASLARQARAEGEPNTASLVVERTQEASACEDAGELAKRIDRIAGRSAIVEGTRPTPLSLLVQFDRSGGKFKAHLVVEGTSHGERDFDDDGSDCTALQEALAVSVALLLDEPPRPPPAPPPPPVVPPAAPPPTTHSEAPIPRTTIDVVALESAGVLGKATFGLSAGFGTRITRYLTVGGEAFGFLDDDEHFGVGALRLDLVATRAPACASFQVPDRSIGGALCGYPALGAMIASGEGFLENRTQALPWFALGASAVGAGPIIGPLAFVGRVDLIVPLARPAFRIESLGGAELGLHGVAYETPPVGVAAGVGIRALSP